MQKTKQDLPLQSPVELRKNKASVAVAAVDTEKGVKACIVY